MLAGGPDSSIQGEQDGLTAWEFTDGSFLLMRDRRVWVAVNGHDKRMAQEIARSTLGTPLDG